MNYKNDEEMSGFIVENLTLLSANSANEQYALLMGEHWFDAICTYFGLNGKTQQDVSYIQASFDISENELMLNRRRIIERVLEMQQHPSVMVEVVTSYESLISELSLGCGHHIYRGVTKSDYSLSPSIVRQFKNREKGAGIEDIDLPSYEFELLNKFKMHSRGKCEMIPEDDWERLFLGQHHGLPTRLLDVTYSSVVGLYFSLGIDKYDYVQVEPEYDCALYKIHFCRYDNYKNLGELISDKNELQVANLSVLTPPSISDRISNQKGLFLVRDDLSKDLLDKLKDEYLQDNDNPSCLLNGIEVVKYIIPRENIVEFRTTLLKIGISNSMIYPDLSGFCKDIVIDTNSFDIHHQA